MSEEAQTTESLATIDSQLEEAEQAITEGNPEDAAEPLAEAQAALTAQAEELAQETAPTEEQASEYRELAERVSRLESLLAAGNLQQTAEEIAQEAPPAAVVEVVEETPAARLESRLKNGYLSPLKRRAP